MPTNMILYSVTWIWILSYVSVGKDILQFETKYANSIKMSPLIIADPDYNLIADYNKPTAQTKDGNEDKIAFRSMVKRNGILYFDPLPGTRIEAEKISQILGVDPFLGKFALESLIKKCSSPSILHMATHGLFIKKEKPQTLNLEDIKPGMIIKAADPERSLIALNDILTTPTDFVDASEDKNNFTKLSGHFLDNPLVQSVLALAGANTWLQDGTLPEEAEDGILTAEDVTGIDLLNTELVVLSACETGLGEILIGEGVFGLRRSFVLAGAQTLVMSLWKVPDNQTKELMVDFYNRLLSGKSRVNALREAQLSMKEKYPNPYYWGAFICQGNPNALLNRY
jgi:CHAT domain-containing protein